MSVTSSLRRHQCAPPLTPQSNLLARCLRLHSFTCSVMPYMLCLLLNALNPPWASVPDNSPPVVKAQPKSTPSARPPSLEPRQPTLCSSGFSLPCILECGLQVPLSHLLHSFPYTGIALCTFDPHRTLWKGSMFGAYISEKSTCVLSKAKSHPFYSESSSDVFWLFS